MTAGLPALDEATVIPIFAVLGGFAGSAAARVQGLGRESLRARTEDGAFVGALVGLAVYVAALLVEVLS